MSPLRVAHLEGAGNRFAFIESADFPDVKKRAELTRHICAATGLDGAVFLAGTGSDFEWDFYNSDGSDAEMCGNAARCVGEYVHRERKDGTFPLSLKTKAGVVVVDRDGDDDYVVEMPPLTGEREMSLVVHRVPRDVLFVSTGVPHIVMTSDHFEKTRDLCRELRSHPDLGPAGANVTLVRPDGDVLQAVTFERGVENFTAACGTGAVAASVWNRRKNGAQVSVIEMPGGPLRVDLTGARPRLAGPAAVIKEFHWPQETK